MLKAIAMKGREGATGILIVVSCFAGCLGFLATASA
jgi:hypothetical protein